MPNKIVYHAFMKRDYVATKRKDSAGHLAG